MLEFRAPRKPSAIAEAYRTTFNLQLTSAEVA